VNCFVSLLLNEQADGEDELKKRQLMELAIINGTYRDPSAKLGGQPGGAVGLSAGVAGGVGVGGGKGADLLSICKFSSSFTLPSLFFSVSHFLLPSLKNFLTAYQFLVRRPYLPTYLPTPHLHALCLVIAVVVVLFTSLFFTAL